MDFSQRLKQLMNERGLNIYSLSKRSGVSWQTIKNYFQKATTPTITTLSMLCDGLGITLAQFFAQEGEETTLTAQQQYLLNRWSLLSEREKKTVSELIDLLCAGREKNG